MIGVMEATKMLACTKAELESRTHAAPTHTHTLPTAKTHMSSCAAVASGHMLSQRKSHSSIIQQPKYMNDEPRLPDVQPTMPGVFAKAALTGSVTTYTKQRWCRLADRLAGVQESAGMRAQVHGQTQ